MGVKSGNRVAWFVALVVGSLVTLLAVVTDCDERRDDAKPVATPGGEIPPEFIAKGRSAIARARGRKEVPLEGVVVESETVQNGPPVPVVDQPELSEEIIDIADEKTYQIGDTDELRRKPRVFRLPRPGRMTFESLRDRLERTFTAENAMNENFDEKRHPNTVTQIKKQEEQVFIGDLMIYFLVDFPITEHPTNDQVVAKMRELGGQPANTVDLMIFVKKVVGSTKFRIRINAIGDDPAILLDDGTLNRSYAMWQKDRLVYQAKDPRNWRPTWAFQLIQADADRLHNGWNFDKGWVQPDDPKDWFLAKRPYVPPPK